MEKNKENEDENIEIHSTNDITTILDETDIPDIKEMCKEPQHLIAF